LLVLDNVEHLLSTDFGNGLSELTQQTPQPNPFNPLPKSADSILTLLARAPTLKCLVTSRQHLDLSGEREFPVLPLPTPPQEYSGNGLTHQALEHPNTRTPEYLLSFPSVQLFVDRAQAVRPDFQITKRNAPTIAELCHRLEGIPLAIELAAARAQTLAPSQMLTQLQRRFDFLTSKRRDVPERHRTLRAAMEWSYRLLPPELRRFWQRLSVFRGGWTLEAAETVAGSGFWVLGFGEETRNPEPKTQNHPCNVLDSLSELLVRSLILTEDTEAGMRFRMLETLREFAAEQLTPDEQADLAQRHLYYYLSQVEAAEPQLRGAEKGDWMERLEAEHDNLRAALTWALQHDAKTALRLAKPLAYFWIARGFWTEGQEWLERCLTQTSDVAIELQANALIIASYIPMHRGEHERAAALCEEALRLSRHVGYREGAASALNRLGGMAFDQGDEARARAYKEESLALRRELGDKHGIGAALRSLGMMAARQGDLTRARALCEEALALERESGNKKGLAISLNDLGTVALQQGDYAQARACYTEGLSLYQGIGNKEGVAMLLYGLGQVSLCQGDPKRARSLAEESLALRMEMDDKRGIAYSLGLLYQVVYVEGDLERARALAEEILSLWRVAGAKRDRALSLQRLGDVAFAQGGVAQAREFYAEGLTLLRECDSPYSVAQGLEGMAKVASAQGRSERAARLFGAADALHQAFSRPLPPYLKSEHDQRLTALRQTLNEPAFTAAYESGRLLTWEQAVADALDETA
jgi:predicted ATPase